MANADNPHGLKPVYTLGGGPLRMRAYEAGVTTAIFKGDVVKMKTSGRLIAELTTTGGADIVGVAANYVAAGTTPATTVWVYDDPFTVFEVQSDGTTDPGATTAQAIIGNCGVLILTTGNTTSGIGAQEIDYSSCLTTATEGSHPLHIVGYYNHVLNDKSLAHARMLVLVGKNMWKKGTSAE